MKFYNKETLANFLNSDVISDYGIINTVLKQHNLDEEHVIKVLIDMAQGKEYASNTIESVSKRLGYIATMDREKIVCEERGDGWYNFGTIHSAKQQYLIKKIEGLWFVKVTLTQSGSEADSIAVQVNFETNEVLNNLFTF